MLGRSGTGKTTSAIYKMIAYSYLFKKLLQTELKSQEKITELPSMHVVLITASDILIKSIQKQYGEIDIGIQNSLRSKTQQRLLTANEKEKMLSGSVPDLRKVAD